MSNHFLEKKRWIKLGLFFMAGILGVASVLLNQLALALVASLAMGYSLWGLKENYSDEVETPVFDKREISSDRLVGTVALVFYAVLFGIGAVYFSKDTESGMLSLGLWLISIVLMIAAGITFDSVNPLAWLKRIKNLSPESRRRLLIEILIISFITAVALGLRVTKLELYPHVMHGDEGETGMEALRVLGIGDPLPPFGVGWGLLPNLLFYMVAGSIRIFGRNEIGVRMISALFGVACVPLVYLIGRKFWGKLAGFSGAWLIAVNHFSIQYSRIGLNIVESTFFMLLFILLFLIPHSHNQSDQGQETNKTEASNLLKDKFNITPYIAAGMICGLAQYMYLGSRLIVLVALPLYIFLLIKKRINIIQIAAVGLTALLVFAPLGTHYFQYTMDFTGRMDTVSIFNPDNIKNGYGQNATLLNSLGLIIKNQFTKNLNFYLQSGDASSFYLQNVPAFDFITALLFWLGLGVVFSRPRRLPEMALILWFVLGVIFGGVLTSESPIGSRLLISTPAVFIIGGVFVQRTWNILNALFHKIPDVHLSLVWLISPLLVGVLVATFGINVNYYFIDYPKSAMTIVPIALAREFISDAPTNHVYLLGDGEIYAGHGTIRFLAGKDNAMDLRTIDDLPPLVKDGKGITIIATFSHFEELNSLILLYPQGEMSNKYVLENLIFMKYQIPPLPLQ